jgi:pullulanase
MGKRERVQEGPRADKMMKWIMIGIMILLGIGCQAKEAEESMDKLVVHYYRYDGDYADWTLWTWNAANNQNSKELKAVSQDSSGLIFQLKKADYGVENQIGLLPKYRAWESKDSPDRIYRAKMANEVWIVQGDDKLYERKPDLRPSIRGAQLETSDTIQLHLWKSLTLSELTITLFQVKNTANNIIPLSKVQLWPKGANKSRSVCLTLSQPIDIANEDIHNYRVEMPDFRPVTLTLGKILDTSLYTSNLPMGAIYSPQKTLFRVFSPTASDIKLLIYDVPFGGKARTFEMEKKLHGIWETVISGNLKDQYYTFKVEGADSRFHPNKELIDPYSLCNTAHNGRGMIISDHTPVSPAPSFDISKAVIYEMHLRDISISPDSGIKYKGKYLGMTEKGTQLPGHPDVKTGLDHIQELGINVVQIMPFQDFENDESNDSYNWGYMPVHFNSPDGWYATERLNARRVEEVKKMVDAFHKKGIKVVMDVVYNHTAENNIANVFSFNGLVPGYYYRLKEDGSFWNGSGTGNEFRSEAPMGRKFIVDSLKYWVTEYKIDGFRFDLMGLIDLDTMQQIVRELKVINPEIMIYGEPWSGGQTPITVTGKGSQRSKGFSVFNDNFRNALKGSPFGNDKGYVVNGNYKDAIKKGILGSVTDFTDGPLETLNYMECHDNRTLWDRLVYITVGDKKITDADRVAMDKLGAVILFTSQGIPFIQAGQEFLRTKGGEENSYNKPDSVNQIDWSLKLKNAEVYHYYQGLIQIRNAHPMLRLKTKDQVLSSVKFLDDYFKLPLPSNCLGYQISRGNTDDSWRNILVLANPNPEKVMMPVPDGEWLLAVDHKEAKEGLLRSGASGHIKHQVELPGRSAMVLFQK